MWTRKGETCLTAISTTQQSCRWRPTSKPSCLAHTSGCMALSLSMSSRATMFATWARMTFSPRSETLSWQVPAPMPDSCRRAPGAKRRAAAAERAAAGELPSAVLGVPRGAAATGAPLENARTRTAARPRNPLNPPAHRALPRSSSTSRARPSSISSGATGAVSGRSRCTPPGPTSRWASAG